MKIRKHWDTHLYTYAYFCLNLHGAISDASRARMKAKCLNNGHTEEQCKRVAKQPLAFIRTGVLIP